VLWDKCKYAPPLVCATTIDKDSVGQFAALEGLNVIGSVGDDAKVEFLTKELGFTSAFNYKKEGYAEALKRLAPDGIDIYYDNVGGEALDEALSAMKLHGRIGKLD
jgi:NADPH-dependent curcumin reductase CurA